VGWAVTGGKWTVMYRSYGQDQEFAADSLDQARGEMAGMADNGLGVMLEIRGPDGAVVMDHDAWFRWYVTEWAEQMS
jgi:hypothetical protein